MGRDKYENEDLIAYGWPEDVWYAIQSILHSIDRSFHVNGHSCWFCSYTSFSFVLIASINRFHVDEFSSAHVYARLNPVCSIIFVCIYFNAQGENIDNMPQELIEDCCQLVKVFL